ncbi:hypothetical protein BCR42DRAFT_462303 [Absidia repens]|uniref:Aminoacyl-tRNA synthetase class II (D/K/N) domain-containing protein n=1 Tax=Absidia repens TaxID=90262 RepID=A0A1X2I7A2_9FUNG|nr:hypothetical protein BCR42DRAFT_462303 [Absidia repens]
MAMYITSEFEGTQIVGIATLLEQQRKLKNHEEQKQKQDELLKKKGEGEAKALERAKFILSTQNASLPKAEKNKTRQGSDSRGKRVRVSGWVHRYSVQCNDMVFVNLQRHISDAITLTTEATTTVCDVINAFPKGAKAPERHELVGNAPDDEEVFSSEVAPDADLSYLRDNSPLVLRGKTSSAVFKARAEVIKGFCAHYDSRGCTDVAPPCGSTLFGFNYYGENSYRAEKSHFHHHLSEYSRSEAKMVFLSFEDMLDCIENLICDVVAHESIRQLIEQLNLGFQSPSQPFLRIHYTVAIKYLKDNDIKRTMGHIPEAPECAMTDKLTAPFYYVALLLNKLLDAYKKEGNDSSPYHWYTVQHKYGTSFHSVYDLGVE